MRPWALATLGRLMKLAKEAEVRPGDNAVVESAHALEAIGRMDLPEPYLLTTEWGSVFFVWDLGHRSLDIEVFNDGEREDGLDGGIEFLVAEEEGGVLNAEHIRVGQFPYSAIDAEMPRLATWALGGEFAAELATYLYPDDEVEVECSVSESGSQLTNPA